MKEMERTERVTGEYFEAMEQVPSRTYYWMALGAMGLSALFFLFGRRNWALFLGQWAPVLLLFPMFYKLLHPSKEEVTRGMRRAAREAMQAPREAAREVRETTK